MSSSADNELAAAPIEEHEVHEVLGALRGQPAFSHTHVVEEVEAEVEQLQHGQPTNPGVLRVALSALVQAVNMMLAAITGRAEPGEGDDSSSE